MTHPGLLVSLRLEGRPCLAVGSSEGLERRVADLKRAGAVVRVVRLGERDLEESDLDGVWLAVLTDRNESMARRMSAACEARRVFFCAVDQPDHNSYSHVAVARAGAVQFGVSTDGHAPALARRLRDELQRTADEADLATFADSMARDRSETEGERRVERQLRSAAMVRLEGSWKLVG